jgi:hypothetical protein
MLYLLDEWFRPEGGETPHYSAEVGDALRIRFYYGELYSPAAWQNTALHRRVLPQTWTEACVGRDGLLTTKWAVNSLYRHYQYALNPGTMIFHRRRLSSVFWCPHAVNVLFTSQFAAPADYYRRTGWRAQKSTYHAIQDLRRKHWLAAVGVILLCGFKHEHGSADVTATILNLLEHWHKQDYSEPRMHTAYVMDEAIEEALQGGMVICAPKRRKLC